MPIGEILRTEQERAQAGEQAQAERQQAQAEYKRMARVWKEGYLQGLDTCLQWQEQNEHLIKDTFRQGLSGSRQLLGIWKDWINDQTEQQKRTQEQRTMSVNPFLGFTKQSTEAVVATVEPLLKNSEAAVESTFGHFENALAVPCRKYVREINKQLLDAVIPS
jgi:hypothetical protein